MWNRSDWDPVGAAAHPFGSPPCFPPQPPTPPPAPPRGPFVSFHPPIRTLNLLNPLHSCALDVITQGGGLGGGVNFSRATTVGSMVQVVGEGCGGGGGVQVWEGLIIPCMR